MLFRLPYFRPKSFSFSGVWLLVWFFVMPSQLLIKFLSLFWNVLFYLYCFTLCRYFLVFVLSPFISSSCTVIFSRVVFSILFPPILGSFCFTILSCFRRFFMWDSSRTSHPGLDCVFVLFEGTPIFSHTNFAPA